MLIVGMADLISDILAELQSGYSDKQDAPVPPPCCY